MSSTKLSANKEGVAKALEALKTFDWGKDVKPLAPIHEAVPAVHGDAEAALELEKQLAPVLKSDVSLAAKDFVIRQLVVIATAESLPTLTELLSDKDLSHRARMVIERIPGEDATKALLDALAKLSGNLKVGVVGSLGNRRDRAAVAALGELVTDSDTLIALAAVTALGDIGSRKAVEALSKPQTSEAVKARVGDALLACAERLIKRGNKSAALAIYETLESSDLPKNAKTAAKRGKLMAM